jgi:hypothetical protein
MFTAGRTVDLVESADCDNVCGLCMWYNRVLQIVTLSPCYNIAATTASLLIAIILYTSYVPSKGLNERQRTTVTLPVNS